MAEFVMKDLVEKAGLAAQFEIASAGTSSEELGNPVYPPVRRLLTEKQINCSGKFARQITRADCRYYDLLICMDHANLRALGRFCEKEHSHKIRLLLDYTDRPGDVADPWYTRDFQATWDDVLTGCQGLLNALKNCKGCNSCK